MGRGVRSAEESPSGEAPRSRDRMMATYEEGFRFADAMSECSMRSKARIDSLFEDSRSIYGSTIGGWYATISKRPPSISQEEAANEELNSANGAVQARIEAMFASVEAESGVPGESAAALLKVRYIGAAPVGGRVASIRGLQEPLRQLMEQVTESSSAELEISHRGLTFRTTEIPDKTSPFRRIAVWSALRLCSKRSKSGEVVHAFLPLVGDEQQQSGGPRVDEKHAELYRVMRGLETRVERYPPIFAVVMRRPGAAKLLECHAFACSSEEDAIAGAATLYRALLADLDANRRRPRQTNGLGCVSLASVASSVAEPSILGVRGVQRASRTLDQVSVGGGGCSVDGSSVVGHPVRPPRSKKSPGTQAERVAVRSGNKLEKAPRRKKMSEIKAEDVLEARSRKAAPGNPRVGGPKELRDGGSSVLSRGSRASGQDSDFEGTASVIGNNSSRPLRPKNKERSFRTKMVQQEARELLQTRSEAGESWIYGEKGEYSGWRSDNYEKVAKMSRSFEYDVNNPEVHYSVVEKGSVMEEEVTYGRYERARDSENSVRDEPPAVRGEPRFSSPRGQGTEAKSCERSSGRSSSRSRDNSIYSNNNVVIEKRLTNREKMYEEHFRDADKIYSEGQEDLGSSGKRKSNTAEPEAQRALEDKFSFSGQGSSSVSYRPGKRLTKNSPDKDPQADSATERPNLVNTLDKPVRKQLQASSEVSKARKRSRACSEPPVGRVETLSKHPEEPKLTRSQSELELDRGDLMTRVELPRRCSFLKPGGSARLPNNVQGGTPLGFTELFDEFRNQEGLTSVDDILAAIIDPEGMSFNDLKPLYKEFLLKLAATLTQDELYQRSASIMRRRRRPQRRRSTRKPCLIGRAIKRSVSKLKGNGPTEFTSVIFPAKKLNDSFDSSSSCEAKNNRTRVLASRLSRRHSSWRNNKMAVGQTTSEDSDTGRRLARNGGGAGANRSSSGYVSCSECSYDSESCTCVSADKCYCSLPRRVPAESAANNACACDTDSCSESNKCYCARKSPQPTILEQLRQRGIVPSESTLSRTGSPDRGKGSRTTRSHASSKSLEFHKIRPSPGRNSSDNLALDYDLFSPGRKSQHSSTASEKVLVVSARDPQGRLVYVGGGDGDKHFQNGVSRTEAHHEALSIKKSAEIAAIFGPGSLRSCRRTSSISSARSSVSLEAGLGYLP